MVTSPIALLRRGIEAGDWNDVCESLFLLTGERAVTPSRKEVLSGADEVLKQIGQILHEHFHGYEMDLAAEADLGSEEDEQPEPASPSPEPEPKRERRSRMEWEVEDETEAEEAKPEPEGEGEPQAAKPSIDQSAREAAQASGRSRSLQSFAIEHNGEPAEDPEKGKRCKTLPMDTASHSNVFKDDKKLARETLTESKQLSQTFGGKEHRKEHKLVKVTCSKCNTPDRVHPDNAPRKLDKGSESTTYVCNRCITRSSK